MHRWGDEWFKKYGNRLYDAIDVLEYRIRKWARCGVYGKEKYGTYRDEYFQMWNGELGTLLFGYKLFHGDNWFEKFIWHLDNYLIPIKKTQFGWRKVGLADFNRWIGLVKLVNKWQARMLNKAAQITCGEYPEVTDELLSDICFYKCIKPCRWGDIDGQAIHDRHWKTINVNEPITVLE